eukprot:CAMPEP_0168585770 /NCGR_PEP_ID=MMETSP0420-20121227/3895_1 /TAXON_ID=498008 /ORGANISM="Pessonella sp." /LENGTH=523 /DNA_ID=CAMNT_0008620751 /DNA_START=158 /DNA_END=1726 /DNA_ORIENTATION=+
MIPEHCKSVPISNLRNITKGFVDLANGRRKFGFSMRFVGNCTVTTFQPNNNTNGQNSTSKLLRVSSDLNLNNINDNSEPTNDEIQEMVFVTIAEQIENEMNENNDKTEKENVDFDEMNINIVEKFCRAIGALSLAPDLISETTTLAVHRQNPLMSRVFNLFSSARSKTRRDRRGTTTSTASLKQVQAVQRDMSAMPAAWKSFQLQHIHALVSVECWLVREALIAGQLEFDATNLYFVVDCDAINSHIVSQSRLIYQLAAVARCEVRPLGEHRQLLQSVDDAMRDKLTLVVTFVSSDSTPPLVVLLNDVESLPVVQEQLEHSVHAVKSASVERRSRTRAATLSACDDAAARLTLASSINSDTLPSGTLPLLLDNENLLDLTLMKQLYTFLPRALRTTTLELRYKMATHGASRHQIFAKQGSGCQLLVLRDAEAHVFGAFVSHAWTLDERAFYGSGSTFLFALRPRFAVFEWTRNNDYFLLCDDEQMCVGGDQSGAFGLCIQRDLLSGSTARCATFANRSLLTCD